MTLLHLTMATLLLSSPSAPGAPEAGTVDPWIGSARLDALQDRGERRQEGAGGAKQEKEARSPAPRGKQDRPRPAAQKGRDAEAPRSAKAREQGRPTLERKANPQISTIRPAAATRKSERAKDAGSTSSRAVRGAIAGASRDSGSPRAQRGARPDHPTGSEIRARLSTLPQPFRRLAEGDRRNQRLVLGATLLGAAHGLAPDALRIRAEGDRIRLLNDRDQLLVDLDEPRARDLGGWDLRRMGDLRPRRGAPAFCRSGEGHPVRGREWCIEKGFGLGSDRGYLWSRGPVEDVVYRREGDGRLDRGGLIGALGDVVFGRLALQAVSLGYAEPLHGVWVADPEGPRILRVHSGDRALAEMVDADRDGRVEVLYVLQPR